MESDDGCEMRGPKLGTVECMLTDGDVCVRWDDGTTEVARAADKDLVRDERVWLNPLTGPGPGSVWRVKVERAGGVIAGIESSGDAGGGLDVYVRWPDGEITPHSCSAWRVNDYGPFHSGDAVRTDASGELRRA